MFKSATNLEDECVGDWAYKELLMKNCSSSTAHIFPNDVCGQEKDLFITNDNVHKILTRSKDDLHLPMANLSVFQKGVYFSGIKIFNNLPNEIKQTSNHHH